VRWHWPRAAAKGRGMMAAKLEHFEEHRELRRRASENRSRKVGRGCPICGAPAAGRYRPFCSARCADVDLARWLNETYRVPGETAERPADSEKTEPD
jgi:endogenous inhibitor of DNA gyrase (YacG/DUF329 family)